MTIAERFAAEVEAAAARGLDGPELLPERLVRAAAAMLPVAGASLSLLEGGDRRVPLASSSKDAAAAERLQFATGDGPCMAAQRLAEPVIADEDELRRRWPAFAERLLRETPFRGVAALPLQADLAGIAAMDVYVRRADRLVQLDIFETVSVGQLISSYLSEAAVFSDWSAEDGPDWLHGPAARRRCKVWQAVGQVSLQRGIEGSAALQVLRSQALTAGRDLEDIALNVLGDRLDTVTGPSRGPA